MDAITIDGPAASGKTAIGLELARVLGYRFLDTGAMYRAVTWALSSQGIDPQDEETVARAIEGMSVEVQGTVGEAAMTRVLVDGVDATSHLREPRVEQNVSLVSKVAAVRRHLVGIQRKIAGEGRVVMAGRDIGSVVLPEARLKVYLDASRDERARRRAAQMQSAGETVDFASLLADLERRDQIDSSREESPLTAAPGAVIINTDDMTIEEVVRRLIHLARG